MKIANNKKGVIFIGVLITLYLMLKGDIAETGVIAWIGKAMTINFVLLLGAYIGFEKLKGSSLMMQKEEKNKWYCKINLKDTYQELFGKLIKSLLIVLGALILPFVFFVMFYFPESDIFMWISPIVLIVGIPFCVWFIFKFIIITFRILPVIIEKAKK